MRFSSQWSTLVALASVSALLAGPARASEPYSAGSWPALTSDRSASEVGDSLTVVIFENASASNSARNEASRDNALSGAVTAGSAFDETGRLSLGSRTRALGETGRAGRMVGQISVTVDEVLANGDLRISGEQLLKVNGEATRIKLRGRVRRADILSENLVLSSRIADAEIDYDGRGFAARGSSPGLLGTIFGFLGL